MPTIRPVVQKRKHQLIATTIKEEVTQFFLNDENSRLAPRKKDSKTFKKVKKQKRYHNETMLSLHKNSSILLPV